MDKRTNFWKFFWKSSKNYEAVERAMKEYKDYQRKLNERLELAEEDLRYGKHLSGRQSR